MTGYVFPLTLEESRNQGAYGYPFIKKNKSRLVAFNFEESSIDLNMVVQPKFVIDDTVYLSTNQYFVKEGSNVLRIIVLIPARQECEKMY